MTASTHHLSVKKTFHTRFRFHFRFHMSTKSAVLILIWVTDGVITKTTTPIVITTREIVVNANALMHNTSVEYKDTLALNQMPAPTNRKQNLLFPDMGIETYFSQFLPHFPLLRAPLRPPPPPRQAHPRQATKTDHSPPQTKMVLPR